LNKDDETYYLSDAFYDEARQILEGRLSEFRLLHSISVSETAMQIARAYGYDIARARIAGLVHDWDKNLSDEELFGRVEEFGIVLPEDSEDMGALLHALTGADSLRRRYPAMPEDIVQAVRRHTSGAVDMSELDIIVYVADMIEPLRTKGHLKTIRQQVGHVSLDELFAHAFALTMEHLIERRRFIHPDSIAVWNRYVAEPRLAFSGRARVQA
jgi:predicted HD superfamily hydrolase involved in NAD metabolism